MTLAKTKTLKGSGMFLQNLSYMLIIFYWLKFKKIFIITDRFQTKLINDLILLLRRSS